MTFLEGQFKRLDNAIAEQLECIPRTLEEPGKAPTLWGLPEIAL